MVQFFSSFSVQAIREQAAATEAAKKDEQACKEDAKLQCTILKEQQDAAAAEQRIECAAACEASARRREEDKAARAAQHQVDRELWDARKLQLQKEKEEQAATQQKMQITRQMNCSLVIRPHKERNTASNDLATPISMFNS